MSKGIDRKLYLAQLKTDMQDVLLEYAMSDLPAFPDRSHIPLLWEIHDSVERLINALQADNPESKK